MGSKCPGHRWGQRRGPSFGRLIQVFRTPQTVELPLLPTSLKASIQKNYGQRGNP